ncbi:potassium channel family protein [Pseudalkalibacillus berkeleyi]|uniref:Potassium channel family protein n=1 Tax=Pseudalkalibacillus berkeleyi TaxID=1069813 RepID=A0ABS9H3V7_9BACL|nr:potassium channel family protein [Pseudalkalibacillus berkeleyi]MCF6138500.1 potassium channel family protein [Pseudalkalibacillus berkeleyi]
MKTITAHYLRLPAILRLIIIVLTVLFLFGTMMHYIEPGNYRTVFDGIYWAVVTAATVGYGDLVPKTLIGKVMTILLIFSGTTFITYFFSQMATYTVKRQNALMKGDMDYQKSGHIVVVGWNERTKTLIEKINEDTPDQHVVLIDRTINKNPFQNSNVHYIHGKSYEDQTLEKANVQFAKIVFITANNQVSEEQSDMDSILTLIAVIGMSPVAKTIVEILTSAQVENAKRAGATEIIHTSTIVSSALFKRMD